MVLSWVAGNDMFLCVWLYETILVDGSATRRPFDFSTCDSAESSLVSKLGRKFVIPHEFHATDMNGLIMQIPCTIPPGKYSIDIKVVQDGYHLRSFEGGVVGIVVENAHAHTTFERISGAHHADYEVELGLIPLAEERPLNMYEEWKLQPGHEDMTFDDFMNDYAQQQVEVAIGDALDSKVDKVQGKGLSTNDFTDILKGKLDDMPNLKKVDSRELDGMISDSDEGFYVADGPGGPLLVEVYKDGATVYQWAVEPHSGHILVRTYNAQAISPAWSEFTDAYDIGSPITEIQRSALDDTTTPGMYKVVGTTGSSAANSSWISLLLVSDYDFSMIGGSTNHIVTQRLFNGRGVSDSVKIEERTKTNNGAWSEWVDIYGSDIDEIWEELDAKQDAISDLATIRSGAAAGATAVQPATMNTALAAKQDTLTFDNAPTANSDNPVQSGGVYDAIEGGFYY